MDLARLRARDPDLLDALVRSLGPRLLAVIRRYARDDDHANDLLQESWVRILERLDSYKPHGSFAGWAAAVTRNVCRSWLRQDAREARREVPIEEVGELPDDTPDVEESEAKLALRTALFEALEGLPDRERQAIVLRILEDRPAREAEEILRTSQEGVNGLVRRGLNRMRRMKTVAQAILAWLEGMS